MSPEVRHIRPGDGADAEGRDVLLPQQRIKGDVGGDGQLPTDVVAVDVSAGNSSSFYFHTNLWQSSPSPGSVVPFPTALNFHSPLYLYISPKIIAVIPE